MLCQLILIIFLSKNSYNSKSNELIDPPLQYFSITADILYFFFHLYFSLTIDKNFFHLASTVSNTFYELLIN